jgi:hypothetical protein
MSDRSFDEIGGEPVRQDEDENRGRPVPVALLVATRAAFAAVPVPPMTDLPQHVLVGQIPA